MKISKLILSVVLFLSAAVSAKAAVDPIVLTSKDDYQVIALSANGKWATGVYVDYNNSTFAFRWNLESNNIVLLSQDESYGNSVSNDGVVVGHFTYKPEDGSATFSCPGYYKDGAWHPVEMPKNMNVGDLGSAGQGGGVTPDGRFMSGAMYLDGRYTPFVWSIEEGGKIVRQLDITNPEGTSQSGNAYCISPDGMYAGGWSYRYNRTATMWTVNDGEKHYIGLTDHNHQSPWASVDKFTADGRKILFGGGWDFTVDENAHTQWGYRIYDMETGEITELPTVSGGGGEMGGTTIAVFGISNAGTLVGSNGDYDYGRAVIYQTSESTYNEEKSVWQAPKGRFLDEYLMEQGVDFKKYSMFYNPNDPGLSTMFRGQDISADGNVICALYYGKTGGSAVGDDGEVYEQAALRSMVILLNQDDAHAAPQDVAVRQMSGIKTVEVTWHKPVRAAAGITGFAIMRDGEKVGTVDANTLKFYDVNVPVGDHTYTVASIYADEETKSPAFGIAVRDQEIQAPQNLFVRQKGINGAWLQWEAPQSNLITKNWYNPSTANLQGFGIGMKDVNIEMGIAFDKEELALYKGSKLTKVNFYPMSKQQNLKLNVYKYNAQGKLELICSQPVTQELNYKYRNTVVLDKPVEVTGENDLVIAFSQHLPQGTNDVLGMDYGRCTPGNSDLIRFVDEADFYSYHDLRSSQNLEEAISFMIDAVLAPEGSNAGVDDIDSYVVYMDGEEHDLTDALNYDLQNATTNTNSTQKEFGVKAVYRNGGESAMTTASVYLAANFKGVDVVDVEQISESALKATWQAPIDDDKVNITYSGDRPGTTANSGVTGPEESNFSFKAATQYGPSFLKGYDGYKVQSVNFYPTTDAVYEFYIVENGYVRASVEVEDYEVGKWNEIMLPEPLTISETSNYYLILDIYDATPYQSPLALDQKTPFTGRSDLYTAAPDLLDATWASVSEDLGIRGNWMMGFNIVAPESKPANVSGYDIYLSTPGKTAVSKVNGTSHVTDTQYTYDFEAPVSGVGRIRVATFYKGRDAVAAQGTANEYEMVAGYDGIEEINTPAEQTLKTFDLSGRQINSTARGLVIMRDKSSVRKFLRK